MSYDELLLVDDEELPRLYPDDEPLVVGFLYVGAELVLLPELLDVVLLLTDALLVLLPTLMPPRIVPLVALTELDGLLEVPWLDVNAPLASVRARRPW